MGVSAGAALVASSAFWTRPSSVSRRGVQPMQSTSSPRKTSSRILELSPANEITSYTTSSQRKEFVPQAPEIDENYFRWRAEEVNLQPAKKSLSVLKEYLRYLEWAPFDASYKITWHGNAETFSQVKFPVQKGSILVIEYGTVSKREKTHFLCVGQHYFGGSYTEPLAFAYPEVEKESGIIENAHFMGVTDLNHLLKKWNGKIIGVYARVE